MTEWHNRYGGLGVMIYWHAERRPTCIYSHLKTCSSSEVPAMIEGVPRHCTDAEIDRNYVDTHGQSAVGFVGYSPTPFPEKATILQAPPPGEEALYAIA